MSTQVRVALRLQGDRWRRSSVSALLPLVRHFPADYNFDHPAAIDFELLAEHLEKLRRGDDVLVPHYDFVHHRRTEKTTHVSGAATTVIIVDGIFVLWAERVRRQCDVTIFTSEDLDVCLARR